MIVLDLRVVNSALAGLSFPARRWELVSWAEFNAASGVVVDALMALPDRAFFGANDIVQAATSEPEPMRLCQHRRHPRTCPLHIGSSHWPVPEREWQERHLQSGLAS
jgi:hypothetical protein